MKNIFTLSFLILFIGACQQDTGEGTTNQQDTNSNPAPEATTTSTRTPSQINQETDFVLEYNVGIINGSKAPDSVKVAGNGRYFDYGVVEVRTQGHTSLSGEQIEFRPKGKEEWVSVSDEDYLFFLGFDHQKHLIIDKGSSVINRDIRLFDIQTGNFVYYTKYNNTLVRDGWLYVLRFVSPQKVEQLPECDTSEGVRTIGYEEVVAIDLNTFQEVKTGQVFCVYK
jgi:hypothetical protein